MIYVLYLYEENLDIWLEMSYLDTNKVEYINFVNNQKLF
jgi:hypothetical protein